MTYRFVDLFCGGGGSITGAIEALKTAGEHYEGRGFNHWDLAITTIHQNHPECVPDYHIDEKGKVKSRYLAPIDSVMPNRIFDTDGERIDCIWASPSCTHHSNAAGGIVRDDQLRCQPEHIHPYLRFTKCRRLYVENVRELLDWGPTLDKDIWYKGKLYKAGRADPRKKGVLFNNWYRNLKSLGYEVEKQILNAADYGAATNRERLIVQAVRKSTGEKIIWPEPTHTQNPGLLSGSYKPWRAAAEIIDWSIPGKSIFGRKNPLCENTMRRIEAGIRKYWGAWAEPFLIVLRGTKPEQLESTAIPLTAPLPTITAEGGHIALIQPIIIDQSHPGELSDWSRCRSSEPMGVITTRNNWSIVQPLFIPQQTPGMVRPVSNPLSTIATRGAIGIVNPFIVEYYGNGGAVSCHDPLHTVTTKDRFGLVEGRVLTLPDGKRYTLDITHRMFTAGELAAATGFQFGYRFAGNNTAIKKQIGNAVPPDLAKALYLAALAA